MGTAAAAAAVMRRHEAEVVDDFRTAGATSPATAQSYTAVGLGHSRALSRLHNRAVIREAAPGLFYLDEEVWAAVRRTRHRLILVMLTIVVALLLAGLFGLIKW